VVLENTTEATDLCFEYYEEVFGSYDEIAQVEAIIRNHYGNISNDDFTGAHDIFSTARKRKVPLKGYAKGLKENLRNEVFVVEVEGIQGEVAVAYYEMIFL
jgi:hypothetical protein